MSGPADIFVEGAKRRHRFDAWQGRSRLAAELFIWRHYLDGTELPGWRAERVRPVRAPGWPPMFQAIWRAPRGRGAVHVTTFECASRGSAHAFLLHALTNVQSPLVARRDDLPVGDIAFADSTGTAVLFARANLVVLCRDLARAPRPVVAAVEQIDAGLVQAPAQAAARDMDLPTVELAGDDATIARVSLRHVAPPIGELSALREAPAAMYKFYSPTGEIYMEDDEILYRPSSAGDQVVRVYELRADAPPATTAVQFSVPGSPD